ncbi:MAG: ABC transporter substrate-binding protein, partial [Pseudomonadota bacterium]
VELRPVPEPVLQYLRQLSLDVVEEIAAADPPFKRVLDSYLAFGEQVRGWNEISEQAYAGAGR